MKKITDFIVEKRKIILVFFFILTGISIYTMQKVNINYELSNYLPETSETRQGMDIMKEEFTEENSSRLYVMFENLDEKEKQTIYEELKQIEGVANVLYDATESYNKEQYTYYVIEVSSKEDSKVAKEVYETIKKNYEEYTTYMSGAIAERNGSVLQTWIVALAIGCAMIILIIMCSSYIEPFLFLFAIGLAVFLNKGTNIIFPSVSNITDSIVAILQMALSMDYSIMLMNRYYQEKEKDKNKIHAMKNALYASFASISSSSITTIVGMLALVFMSFTIGRDLGFVLAKGVLFSLLSIFICLPGLILLFDKWIQKTKKKVFSMKLDRLGKFAEHIRIIAPILLVVLFIGSYFLKGNLLIAYTSSEEDKIADVFPENNQIAVIYKNELEEKVASFCRSLHTNDKLQSVLCYGNTIHEDLKYTDLQEKMKELGTTIDVSNDLLKLVYFDYYNKEEIKLSYEEFIRFIEDIVLKEDTFKDKIDASLKNNIRLLGTFVKKEELGKKRNAQEIAELLGLEKNIVEDLFVYYNAKNISTKITLPTFIRFLNKEVVANPKYASSLPYSSIEKVKMLETFMDKSVLTTNVGSENLANLFSMEEESVKKLLYLYASKQETTKTMSIKDFISSVLFLKKNTSYLDTIDTTSLEILQPISTNENHRNETKVNKDTLANIFDATLVEQLYIGLQLPPTTLFSPIEFVTFTLEQLQPFLAEEQIKTLSLVKKVMEDSINDFPAYTSSVLAKTLGLEQEVVYQMYALSDLVADTMEKYTMSPVDFGKFVLQNKELLGLDAETIGSLQLLDKVFAAVVNNTSFTPKELSSLFGMEEESIRLLYSLYSSIYVAPNFTISLQTMIPFLVEDVLQNKTYASFVEEEVKSTLIEVHKIMVTSLQNKKFRAQEITDDLQKIAKELDGNIISLLYTYYGSVNAYKEEWQMNIMNLVTYLHDTLMKDERLEEFITENIKNDIISAKEKVWEAKNMLVGENYSRMILNTSLLEESEETFAFIKHIKDNLTEEDIYVIGNSPMALEMSETFQGELDLITVLTMAFIFIVVAFTFKSLLIPFVLVLLIQCAVYVTMGILSVMGGSVYFIALLIVQSILMGATIDYAILYTSYYLESRDVMDRKQSLINAYNKSIHTILTSASILILVTLIVGSFASAIAAKICKTLSEGTLCSTLLILLILPATLAAFDKWIVKKKIK